MMEPCSPGPHRRSFTGESGQMRDRYTALWPEPVMRATLVSSDSLRTMPTSARTAPEQNREPESRRAMNKCRFKAVLFPHEFSIHQDAGARSTNVENTSGRPTKVRCGRLAEGNPVLCLSSQYA